MSSTTSEWPRCPACDVLAGAVDEESGEYTCITSECDVEVFTP